MKRYDVERGAKWIEKINGMFVLHEDVAALRASHSALVEAAVEVGRSRIEEIAMGGLRVTTVNAASMDRLDDAVAKARTLDDAALRASHTALVTLVRAASRDSCVTTSSDPGCFYCDHEGHTLDCPADAALTAAKELEESNADTPE